MPCSFFGIMVSAPASRIPSHIRYPDGAPIITATINETHQFHGNVLGKPSGRGYNVDRIKLPIITNMNMLEIIR